MAKTPEQWWHEAVEGRCEEHRKLMQHCVKAACAEARQAQHEATWAMAMEAAANFYRTNRRDLKGPVPRVAELIGSEATFADAIGAIPCPPLQTTNEKSE